MFLTKKKEKEVQKKENQCETIKYIAFTVIIYWATHFMKKFKISCMKRV